MVEQERWPFVQSPEDASMNGVLFVETAGLDMDESTPPAGVESAGGYGGVHGTGAGGGQSTVIGSYGSENWTPQREQAPEWENWAPQQVQLNATQVLSVGSYLLMLFVLIVPLVNWVVYGYWAFAPGINTNKRNLSRAGLIYLVGSLILSTVGLIVWKLLKTLLGW